MKYLHIFFFLINLSAFAQGTLKGNVTDENDKPLAGAYVVLAGTSEAKRTDHVGNFIFNPITTGPYTVQISYVGFTTQTVNTVITNGSSAELTIVMHHGEINLDEIVITGSQEHSANTLSPLDIALRPVNTSQDILRLVPGLFIAQHAGGGKAEQIFLRGFDCDHGTDINISVDGMPVNMVSHAHGQGYADLHFLIPELVKTVDFNKGPYYADKGDLNTAGYVEFETASQLDRNFVKLEGGSFGTGRAVAGINLPFKSPKANAYIASEFFRTDGFFENSQNMNRRNLHGRFNTQIGRHTYLTAALSGFISQWNASGQIPDRAVVRGEITRYGSIDPSEGGNTSRYNAYIKTIHDFSDGSSLENQLYGIRYYFSLFSNFTFYLKDSVNGDQIHQQESRMGYGYHSRYRRHGAFAEKRLDSDIGGGIRYDVIDNIALSHTVKRSFLNDIQRGDIHEANFNGYVSETFFPIERLSINAALRFDYFRFGYLNQLGSDDYQYSGKGIVSPKLNITYNQSNHVSFFVRAGTGFHSNDARVVIMQSVANTLPRAYSIDIGTETKITPTLLLQAALWRLDLDQEFVYVGDEGIVEPAGKTKRMGFDLSARYQLNKWLFLDTDFNITDPKAKHLPKGENYIPLAPRITSIGGLTVRRSKGFNGSLRYRYMATRPANENNTVKAQGYFVTDVILNYSRTGYEIGISTENLLNTKWREAQFDTESRLKNETAAVSEIHYTPGTPFACRIRFVKYF